MQHFPWSCKKLKFAEACGNIPVPVLREETESTGFVKCCCIAEISTHSSQSGSEMTATLLMSKTFFIDLHICLCGDSSTCTKSRDKTYIYFELESSKF